MRRLLLLLFSFSLPVFLASSGALADGPKIAESGPAQICAIDNGASISTFAYNGTVFETAESHFVNAVAMMRAKKYRAAIPEFDRAIAGMPLIGDYALLYEARAFSALGDTGDATDALQKLLASYPKSPLIRKARLAIIGMTTDDGKLYGLLKEYVGRYPGDGKMAFKLARMFKAKGETGKANELFTRLYVAAGPAAGAALKELGRPPMPAETLLRAENLIRAYRYRRAERELRSALANMPEPAAAAALDNAPQPSGTSAVQQAAQPQTANPGIINAPASVPPIADSPAAAKALPAANSLVKAGAQPEIFPVNAQSGRGKQLEMELTSLLGKSLFMQKRYIEAAGQFVTAGNMFFAARAYFRAGDKNDFEQTLNYLIGDKDERAADLLIAFAAKERRSGDYNGALQILNNVLEQYPLEKEDTLWEIGWLYYMQKDFKDALHVFSKLADRYREPGYIYWKAKSMEALGMDASALYNALSRDNDEYYGVLASFRVKGASRAPENAQEAAFKPVKKNVHAFLRAQTLFKAGLKDEAVSELIAAARRTSRPQALIAIAFKLKELGAFRRAILVADGLPEEMQPREIMYPRAYWNTVEKSCSKNGLDPYLLLSVMREESRFDPNVSSPAGAIGLMQLMPRTVHRLSRALSLTESSDEDIYRIELNLQVGAYYLKKLYSEFNAVPPALAAYNAGRSAVKSWLSSGNYASYDEFIEDIPYFETKNYVKRIITSYYQYRGEKAAKGFFRPEKAGTF